MGPGQEPVCGPRAGCHCPYPASDPQALVHLKCPLKKSVKHLECGRLPAGAGDPETQDTASASSGAVGQAEPRHTVTLPPGMKVWGTRNSSQGVLGIGMFSQR